MKILTVLGTRPEIIRLSCIIKSLDRLCDHTLVQTGQNYDPGLSKVFFDELEVRRPDFSFEIQSKDFANQVAQMFQQFSKILDQTRPDRVLVLGDTNSGLTSIIAARKNIPIYHMEAGNRCYDHRVPEEVNRRLIDHCSTVLLPYTYRSRENLLKEGIRPGQIFVTGNPIYEVLKACAPQIEASSILQQLQLEANRYFLATIHRAENVDQPERLEQLVNGLSRTAKVYEMPVVVSLHPRTADRLAGLNWESSQQVQLLKPLGFFDFVKLEQAARCVLTDSGTVQEECCIFRVPAVTLRDVTERPETIDAGSNILSGAHPDSIQRCVKAALDSQRSWNPPAEYLERNCSEKVTRILLSFHAGFE